MTPGEAVPRRAAGIILLRDSAAGGIEVFMSTRIGPGSGPGALVFPGGKVDEDDRITDGASPSNGKDPLRVDAIAAIRETWEEVGILFARSVATGSLVDADSLAAIRARHADAYASATLPFSALLAREGLEPATDRLAYFAHWISPDTAPRRFDTRFFLASCPLDQAPAHDGREMGDGFWIKPADAFEAALSGRFEAVFPTKRKLAKLSRYGSVDDAFAHARGTPVVTVQAVITRTPTGRILRIPAEAGYDGAEFEERS